VTSQTIFPTTHLDGEGDYLLCAADECQVGVDDD